VVFSLPGASAVGVAVWDGVDTERYVLVHIELVDVYIDGEGVEVMVVRWPEIVVTNVVGAKVLTKVRSVSP
jgi:hypothetical protein